MLAIAGPTIARDMATVATGRRWLVALGCLWAASAMVSSWLVAGPAASSSRWAIYLAFGLVLLVLLRRRPEAAERLLPALAAGYVSYASVLVAFVATADLPSNYEWVHGLPGAGNVRHLGFEAVAAALVGSLYRPVLPSRGVTWLLRITAVAGWTFVFWSGGRGSLLSVLAAVAIAAAFSPTGRRRRLAEAAALGVAGLALSLLHQPPGASFGIWRTIGVETIATAEAGIDVTSGRTDMWREAVRAIAANPFFGIGEGQMKHQFVTAHRHFQQPHNLFLQAPLAWGIPGGLAFLVGIWFPIVRAAARVRGRAALGSTAMTGFAVATAMTANAMLDASLFHPRPVTIFLIGLCLALVGPLTSGQCGCARPRAPDL
jgi:O-antigen ligase